MEIYCVTCKEKTDTKSPKKFTMKNGMSAVRGICSDCGGKVCVITGKSDKAVTRNASEKTAKLDKPSKSGRSIDPTAYNLQSANMLIKELSEDQFIQHKNEIAWLKGYITGCKETSNGTVMHNPAGLEREMQIQGVMKLNKPKAPKSVDTDPFGVRKPRSKAK